jgi:uncharacterized NAD(P)/FAD-binding protein YdhS
VAVLCIGNLRPRQPPAPGVETAGGPRLIANPWEEASLSRIQPADAVLVLGSGLTRVGRRDPARRGHRGPILAPSRHGLLLTEHAPKRRARPLEWRDRPLTVRGLLRHIRRQTQRAARLDADWRPVLDAWRDQMPLFWQWLQAIERRRVLRHVRPWWDIHRRRMAPRSLPKTKTCRRAAGSIRAGTIVSYQGGREGDRSALSPRGGDVETLIVADWLVNCAGPTLDFLRIDEPLVRDLLARGSPARTSSAGPRDEPRSAAAASERAPEPGLVRARSADPGTFWEASAVPETREQGRTLSRRLLMNSAA